MAKITNVDRHMEMMRQYQGDYTPEERKMLLERIRKRRKERVEIEEAGDVPPEEKVPEEKESEVKKAKKIEPKKNPKGVRND